jgi:hypothetical protein
VAEDVVEHVSGWLDALEAKAGMSNQSASGAQCRVLCAPVIDSAISRTMEMMASLFCSVAVMVLLLSMSRPVLIA